MSVFLSHINEEAQVASVLAQWIESSLDRDVHVSGEADKVQLGEQRLAEIDQALGEAKVVLLLCSSRSIGRPWISFESGCAWFKGVPVVAVCHSGCSTADLLPPLRSFKAVELADAASCQALLETLAGHLERKRVPRVDYDLMVTELRAAMDPSRAPKSKDVPKPVAARPSEVRGAVPAKQAAVTTAPPLEVRLLAMMKRVDEFTCTAESLAAELGEQERKVRDSLDKLVSNHLLTQRASIHPTDPDTRYALTEKGRIHLARQSS